MVNPTERQTFSPYVRTIINLKYLSNTASLKRLTQDFIISHQVTEIVQMCGKFKAVRKDLPMLRRIKRAAVRLVDLEFADHSFHGFLGVAKDH